MPHLDGPSKPLYYERHGDPGAHTLLLVHGLGGQLIEWPDSFVQGFVDRGLQVVTFDNRDVGLSEAYAEHGMPDVAAFVAAAATGTTPAPPYRLAAMADDAFAVLDAVGADRAHVLGVSMGGMIVQRMGIARPERLHGMISVMSSTGDPSLPPAEPEAMGALLTPPPALDRDTVIAHARRAMDVIGGPHYRSTELGWGRVAAAKYDRAYGPDGVARQFAAILADGDRTAELAGVRVPTLVVHGDADPLVPPACGEATARAIPGAELVMLPRMGHDLPEPLVPRLVEIVGEFVARTLPARETA